MSDRDKQISVEGDTMSRITRLGDDIDLDVTLYPRVWDLFVWVQHWDDYFIRNIIDCLFFMLKITFDDIADKYVVCRRSEEGLTYCWDPPPKTFPCRRARPRIAFSRSDRETGPIYCVVMFECVSLGWSVYGSLDWDKIKPSKLLRHSFGVKIPVPSKLLRHSFGVKIPVPSKLLRHSFGVKIPVPSKLPRHSFGVKIPVPSKLLRHSFGVKIPVPSKLLRHSFGVKIPVPSKLLRHSFGVKIPVPSKLLRHSFGVKIPVPSKLLRHSFGVKFPVPSPFTTQWGTSRSYSRYRTSILNLFLLLSINIKCVSK